MRLGGKIFESYSSAEEWALAVKRKGYQTALAPVSYTASDREIESYKQAAKEHDIVIGEVGIWNNIMHVDKNIRESNRLTALRCLELAEELEACCCVNVAGSYNDKVWYGPHPDNFSEKMYEEVVSSIQYLIDRIKPRKTSYTLEPSPWMFPDSIEAHEQLIKDIDREAFGVHFDPVNMMFTPKIYFENGGFIKEAIDRLGKYIKSCHVKDVFMDETFTIYIRECNPGEGIFDYDTFIKEIDRLNPEMPVFIEHMESEEEYDIAAAYVTRKMKEMKCQKTS